MSWQSRQSWPMPFPAGFGFFLTQQCPTNSPRSRLSRFSTMASSQQQKGRAGVLATLELFIQTLCKHRERCPWNSSRLSQQSQNNPGAFLPVPQTQASDLRCPGYDGQRSRLLRAWVGLRSYVPATLSEIEREPVGGRFSDSPSLVTTRTISRLGRGSSGLQRAFTWFRWELMNLSSPSLIQQVWMA